MKNIVLIFSQLMMAAITLVIVMCVYARLNRSIELQGTLPSIIEESVEQVMLKHTETPVTTEYFMAEVVETILFTIETESDVTVDFFQCDLEKGIVTLAQLSTKRWDILFEKYQVDFDSKTFDTYYRKYLSLSGMHVQGAEELLAYLSDKYDVYSASNGPFNQQINRLKLSGLSKYIKGNFNK